MRVSSRRILPQTDPKIPLIAWLFLTAILGGLVLLAESEPFVFAFVCGIGGIIVIVSAVLTARSGRRLEKLAASRRGESICTFARSFDCREIDTRIIRAAHEELQPYYNGICPIRATDRLLDEIGIDEDDLDTTAVEIARRSGRSLDRSDENPFVGKVETVADLVHFLTNQPLVD